MRDLKNLIILTALIIFSAWFAQNNSQLPDVAFYSIVIGIPIFYLVRILLSKRVKHKKLVTHKLNFWSAKRTTQITLDLDLDTTFELLQELPTNMEKISLVDSDKTNSSLLFLTKANWLTWGSNVYINLESVNSGQTNVIIHIVAFQLYNWGENEKILEQIKFALDSKLMV